MELPKYVNLDYLLSVKYTRTVAYLKLKKLAILNPVGIGIVSMYIIPKIKIPTEKINSILRLCRSLRIPTIPNKNSTRE